MAIHKTAGTRFYIGPVVNIDTIKDATPEDALTAFEAIEEGDWTEVDEIESFGDLGDTSEEATFASVKDSRSTSVKTIRTGSTLVVVCARDPLDDGQIALIVAEKEDFNYRFRMSYNDARDENHSASTEFFAGLVMSRPTNLGGVQDITKRTFNIKQQTDIYADDSDPTGS